MKARTIPVMVKMSVNVVEFRITMETNHRRICKKFLDWAGGGRKTDPEYGRYNSMSWGPRVNERESELSTNIYLPLRPV